MKQLILSSIWIVEETMFGILLNISLINNRNCQISISMCLTLHGSYRSHRWPSLDIFFSFSISINPFSLKLFDYSGTNLGLTTIWTNEREKWYPCFSIVNLRSSWQILPLNMLHILVNGKKTSKCRHTDLSQKPSTKLTPYWMVATPTKGTRSFKRGT